MGPPNLLISRVNPFPSRSINRTIFFCNALESHECACCLLFDGRQYYCHFSIFIGSFFYQRTKPPQGTVLFINLLGKGLTSRACMRDRGSIWWAPVMNLQIRRKRRTKGCDPYYLLWNRYQQHAISPVSVACGLYFCQARALALTMNISCSQLEVHIKWLLTLLLCCPLFCEARKNQVELVTLLPQL